MGTRFLTDGDGRLTHGKGESQSKSCGVELELDWSYRSEQRYRKRYRCVCVCTQLSSFRPSRELGNNGNQAVMAIDTRHSRISF